MYVTQAAENVERVQGEADSPADEVFTQLGIRDELAVVQACVAVSGSVEDGHVCVEAEVFGQGELERDPVT